MADEKKEAALAELTGWLLSYVEEQTAGSPTDETIKWTPLRDCEIVAYLHREYGVEVGTKCVKRILYEHGYRKRKPAKVLATRESADRSEQFRIIAFLLAVFGRMDENPIISIDTKNRRWQCSAL